MLTHRQPDTYAAASVPLVMAELVGVVGEQIGDVRIQ